MNVHPAGSSGCTGSPTGRSAPAWAVLGHRLSCSAEPSTSIMSDPQDTWSNPRDWNWSRGWRHDGWRGWNERNQRSDSGRWSPWRNESQQAGGHAGAAPSQPDFSPPDDSQNWWTETERAQFETQASRQLSPADEGAARVFQVWEQSSVRQGQEPSTTPGTEPGTAPPPQANEESDQMVVDATGTPSGADTFIAVEQPAAAPAQGTEVPVHAQEAESAAPAGSEAVAAQAAQPGARPNHFRLTFLPEFLPELFSTLQTVVLLSRAN